MAVNVRGEHNGGDKLNDDVKQLGRSRVDQLHRQYHAGVGFAVGLAYLDSPSSNRHTKGYNYETFCCGQEHD